MKNRLSDIDKQIRANRADIDQKIKLAKIRTVRWIKLFKEIIEKKEYKRFAELKNFF